jgi:uncharacterized membrane protein YdbT with pleckstrin-like domain
MRDIRWLDPKVKMIWMFPTLSVAFIFILVSLVASFVMPSEFSILGIQRQNVFLTSLFVITVVIILIYIWIELIYRNFTYEFGENDIIVREGVITRKTTVIPYITIQDISSERNLLERMLGLATLEIETAGSSREASEAFLPGVSNKDALIREIMDKVQQAKARQEKVQKENDNKIENLLSEILKELKNLSSKFEKSSLFEEYQKFKNKK